MHPPACREVWVLCRACSCGDACVVMCVSGVRVVLAPFRQCDAPNNHCFNRNNSHSQQLVGLRLVPWALAASITIMHAACYHWRLSHSRFSFHIIGNCHTHVSSYITSMTSNLILALCMCFYHTYMWQTQKRWGSSVGKCLTTRYKLKNLFSLMSSASHNYKRL
jgi:hypothetical protein